MITVAILGCQTLPSLAVKAALGSSSDIHVTDIGMMDDVACLKKWAKHPPKVLVWVANPAECQWYLQLKKIQRYLPNTPILFLADKVDNIYPNRLLKAGVCGYLSQQEPVEHLITAVHHITNGKCYHSPDIVQHFVETYLAKKPASQPFDQLSNRELEIVQQLVKGHSANTIAKAAHIEHSTVNCYTHKLLKRLQCNNTIELVHLAVKYQLIDPPTSIPSKLEEIET